MAESMKKQYHSFRGEDGLLSLKLFANEYLDRVDPKAQVDFLYPEKGSRGRHNETTLIITRHGNKTMDGRLTPYGEDQAVEEAKRLMKLGITPDRYDGLVTLGSGVGPLDEYGLSRANRTAKNMNQEILSDVDTTRKGRRKNALPEGHNKSGMRNVGLPRLAPELNFERMKLKMPYDHSGLYNGTMVAELRKSGALVGEPLKRAEDFLKAKDYKALGKLIYEEMKIPQDVLEKAEDAGTVASTEHAAALNTPEGLAWKREGAGAGAHLVLHWKAVTEGMESRKKLMITAGGHGGVLSEWLLQEALIWQDDKGKHAGFKKLEEIGGPILPAEAYAVNMKTGSNGKVEKITVRFTRPGRPTGECTLDMKKLAELSAHWEEMHKDDPQDISPRASSIPGKKDQK
jgi:hypothetical protein